MGTGTRQLKAMLRKNWLLKIRHPYVTCAEVQILTLYTSLYRNLFASVSSDHQQLRILVFVNYAFFFLDFDNLIANWQFIPGFYS